jgi:hypothetical protein
MTITTEETRELARALINTPRSGSVSIPTSGPSNR